MGKPSFNKSRCYGGIIKCTTTGKYLLVKGFTGKWSFPKGHREKNETPLDCAKREIYEETGIQLQDIQNKKATFVSIYYYYNCVTELGFTSRRRMTSHWILFLSRSRRRIKESTSARQCTKAKK